MPEKTLKEKVDAAKIQAMYIQANSEFRVAPIIEALMALEERVEELEKERALVKQWVNGYFRGMNYDTFLDTVKIGYEQKEAPDDGGK